MVDIWLMMVDNLVGGVPTPLKNDGELSVGIMTFPTEWKNRVKMFQSTNQYLCRFIYLDLGKVHYVTDPK